MNRALPYLRGKSFVKFTRSKRGHVVWKHTKTNDLGTTEFNKIVRAMKNKLNWSSTKANDRQSG